MELTREGMSRLLAVTRSLAAPFELQALLRQLTQAATELLDAERSSVWLHDARTGDLELAVTSDLGRVRVPMGVGLVGACARDRRASIVADCYSDPRFDPEVDRRSGYRTRCILSLPLEDLQGGLVGVMQVLNRHGGVFEPADLPLAEALAAQCALALSRAQATEALVERERLAHELDLARAVQLGTLPRALPQVPGYRLHASFRPAEQTGGDTYDVSLGRQGLALVLGDAAGHGIGAALAVTQMHAMLRMALRLGSGLEAAFREVNDQLAETLTDGRFVTAFIGLLDPQSHRLRYLSGGQGPILHLRGATGDCIRHGATSFPMGAMPIAALRPAGVIDFQPGDLLALVTDGVFEQRDPDGAAFGVERAVRLLSAHRGEGVDGIAARLLDALRGFMGSARQDDDITLVLVQREPVSPE